MSRSSIVAENIQDLDYSQIEIFNTASSLSNQYALNGPRIAIASEEEKATICIPALE